MNLHTFHMNDSYLTDFHEAVSQASIISKADQKGIITYVNQNFVDISGYSREELVGKRHNVINSGHHPKTFWADMWRTILSGKPWRAEVRNRAKNGRYYWVDTFIIPMKDNSGIIREFLSIRNDITNRIESEQALDHSLASLGTSLDQRFSRTTAHLPGFIFQLRLRRDGTFHYPYVSDGVTSIFGISPEEARDNGSNTLQWVPAEDVSRFWSTLRESRDNLALWTVELRVNTPDGTTLWLDVKASPHQLDDRSTVWNGFAMDITQRKQHELQILQSNERYLNIIDNLPGFIFRRDLTNNTLTFVGGEVQTLLGMSPADYQQQSKDKFRFEVLEEDAAKLHELVEHSLAAKVSYEIEYRIRTRDGIIKWVSEKGKGLSDKKGNLFKHEAYVSDITNRKHLEIEVHHQKAHLEETNMRYFLASQAARLGIWDMDLQTGRIVWDDSLYSMIGVDPRQPVTTEFLQQIVEKSDIEELMERMQNLSPDNPILEATFRARHQRTKELRYIKTFAICRFNEKGHKLSVVGVDYDTTEAQLASMRLEESESSYREQAAALTLAMEEKDVLLQELHHRIKNNLQLISSLIFLKLSTIHDKEIKAFLVNIRQNLKTMAMMHEHLIHNPGTNVNLGRYLGRVVTDYGNHEGGMAGIEMITALDNLEVTKDTALNCALILNEVVANAMKHAFAGITSPRITIQLQRRGDQEAELRIENNGIPLPEEISPSTASSFGMRLLYSFTKQIHGELSVHRDAGTCYSILFPV